MWRNSYIQRWPWPHVFSVLILYYHIFSLLKDYVPRTVIRFHMLSFNPYTYPLRWILLPHLFPKLFERKWPTECLLTSPLHPLLGANKGTSLHSQIQDREIHITRHRHLILTAHPGPPNASKAVLGQKRHTQKHTLHFIVMSDFHLHGPHTYGDDRPVISRTSLSVGLSDVFSGWTSGFASS